MWSEGSISTKIHISTEMGSFHNLLNNNYNLVLECLTILLVEQFDMFGFGKKKKLEEFAKLLSELGDITQQAADKYVADNEIEIQAAFKRGLNPFASLAYIADNQMERISNAHHLGELHLAKNIDDFWLLVALNCVVAMQSAGVPSEQLNFNFKYWNKVIEMPIDPASGEFTYGDRLQLLVDAMKAKTT